jgi:hypothetical protein
MTDRPVRVVLDASAIVAFTRGSIDVGEVLGEIADEGAVFALPTLCLSEAASWVADESMFRLLTRHPASTVVGVEGARWGALADTVWIVGAVEAASAVLAAERHDCHVMTARPGLYGGLANGGDVIEI